MGSSFRFDTGHAETIIVDMDKKELLEILEAHFPTKEEHKSLVQKVSGIEKNVSELKEVVEEHSKKLKRIDVGVQELNEKLDESRASNEALDKVLEKHPIERIERVEKHLNLPNFVATFSGEED